MRSMQRGGLKGGGGQREEEESEETDFLSAREVQRDLCMHVRTDQEALLQGGADTFETNQKDDEK